MDSPRQIAVVLIDLGRTRRARGDLHGAETALRRALGLLGQLYPDGHGTTLLGLESLVRVAWLRGEIDKASTWNRESLTLRRRLRPRDQVGYTSVQALFAKQLILAATQPAAREAERLLRESLAIRTKEYPDGHAREWLRHNAASLLGAALFGQAAPVLVPPEGSPRPADAAAKVARAQLKEATSLLIDSAEWMLTSPRGPKPDKAGVDRAAEAGQRVVRLQELLHPLRPDGGHAAAAKAWRAKVRARGPAPDKDR